MNNSRSRLTLVAICVILVVIGAAQGLDGTAAARVSPKGGEQRPVVRNAPVGPQARATLTPGPTEGPPRPTLTPRPSPAAQVCLRLSIDDAGAISPSTLIAYRLVAHNSGRGRASYVNATFLFASTTQTIVDASFASPTAWVSGIFTDAIEMRLGPLGRDEIMTATLRLRVGSDIQPGTSLLTRAHMKWSDDGKGGEGFSNRLSLAVGQTASNPIAPLKIAPSDGTSATTFTATYDGFASNEQVSLWYHQPDGRVVALEGTRADAQGQITVAVSAATFATGRYTLVAHGQCSQVSALGVFTVLSA